MLTVLLGVAVGLLIPWQTVANTRLRTSLGSPFAASMVSFAVGTVGLLAAAAPSGALSRVLADAHQLSWWMFAGGALGVVALTGNIFMFPRLGAVETVVLPIAGQILAGLVIDQFGFFRAPVNPLTWLRLGGAAVVMAGVLITVGRPQAAGTHVGGWRAAGVGFGALLAAQSAINGQLGHAVGSPLVAALVSFAVGMVLLVLINAVLGWRPHLHSTKDQRGPWWMWTGGLLGAMYVLVNAWLVPAIGTGLTVMAGLAGVMAGSLLVDRAFGKPVRPTQLVGVAAIAAGVALMRLD